MPTTKIVKALRALINETGSAFEESDDSREECQDTDSFYAPRRKKKVDKKKKKKQYFCWEDTFLSKDINLQVDGIKEKITFPLNERSVKNLLKISSKAKFGSGADTVLDTKVRDTQMIPASQLKIDMNQQAFSAVLERMISGLKLDSKSKLEPHLHNLLIYGPGQFFKKHRDSEKMPNMIATLVILLPSPYKGGDLIVEHNDSKHVFFASQNPEIVKCIAFYADCQHEIQPVTEGYRVAVTYNVVLKKNTNPDNSEVNERLDKAVASYFNSNARPSKLIFHLNHAYSKNNLNWDLLKGNDRIYGNALLKVAKKQGRIPYLSLMTYSQLKESEFYNECGRKSYSDSGNDEVYEETTEFEYWINEENARVDDKYIENFEADDDEMCYTKETTALKPSEAEESGPTGNEGATCHYWYKRASIILFANKWQVPECFESCIRQLYALVEQEASKKIVSDEIARAGPHFMEQYVHNPTVAEMLIKIVCYSNDSKLAEQVLSCIPEALLVAKNVQTCLQLEKQFDVQIWVRIVDKWKRKNWTMENIATFFKKYQEIAGKTNLVKSLIFSDMSSKEGFKLAVSELHESIVEPGKEDILSRKIDELNDKFYKLEYWTDPENCVKLLEIALYLKNPEKAIKILSRLPKQLLTVENANLLMNLENQYDSQTWGKIVDNWKTSKISFSYYYSSWMSHSCQGDPTVGWAELLASLTPFLLHYNKISPKSTLPQVLLSESLIAMKNKNYTVENQNSKMAKANILNVCQLLKVCVALDDGKNKSEVQNCIESVSTKFPLASKAELVIEMYKQFSRDVILNRFDAFQKQVAASLDVKINELNAPWSPPSTSNCACVHCVQVLRFFDSKQMTIVIPAAKAAVKHMEHKISPTRDLTIKTIFERNRYKLSIEKHHPFLKLSERDHYRELLTKYKQSISRIMSNVSATTMPKKNEGETASKRPKLN